MVAVATMLFVAFSAASSNLRESCRYTYDRLKFLDFYFQVHSAQPQLVDRIASLRGVESVEGRRVLSLRIHLSNGNYMAGRAIGIPVGHQPKVNQLYLEGGRYLSERHGEVLMERRFALAHGFRLNDPVEVEINGVFSRFTLVGLVSSPEYVWLATGRGDPRPAARRFGVLFVSQRDACSLDGRDGINEIHVRIHDQGQLGALMEEARRHLESYVKEGPVGREQQPSNELLLRDQRAFAGVATLFPILFLSLSSIILVSTLTQLIAQQRRQIGVLMSQGFSAAQLMSHYLVTSAFVGGSGALLGASAGWLLGEGCSRYYAENLGLPFLATHPPLFYMLLSPILATAVSVGAGWRAASRLVHLDPAEVLRSDFSASQRTFRARAGLPGLGQAPYLLRLPLRNLLRQPIRTLVVVMGIALAVVQMVFTLMLLDSQRSTLEFFFQSVHRYDMQVDLHLTSPAVLPPIQSWPGVSRVEGVLWWRMRLQLGPDSVETGVLGVPAGSELLRPYDRDRRPLEITPHSPLLLGPVQLRQLHAHPGDYVQVQSTTNRELAPIVSYVVGPELFEPIALPVKLPLKELQQQVAAGDNTPTDVINLLYLKVAPEAQESVRRRLYTCPLVESVIDPADTRADIHDLLKMLNTYLALMIGCSSLLAIALLAGCSTMNVMERLRELATLSILGVSDATLVTILVIETLLAWLLGLTLGLPTGVVIGNWLLAHYQSDLIQLTLSVNPLTLLGTALGSLLICLGATAASLRRVLGIPLATAAYQAD